MATNKLVQAANDTLEQNRRSVQDIVRTAGDVHARELLQNAETDLQRRLVVVERMGPGADSFTATQMRATLVQIQVSIRELTLSMRTAILKHGEESAGVSTEHAVKYMKAADKAFRGVGVQPLALREASMLSYARKGAESSVLRRLASNGKPTASRPHPAKVGILQRYGMETVGHFEKILEEGMVQRKSFREMREELRKSSPFLQQAPAYWAQRIVRTEVMAAYARGTHENIHAAHKQLGDIVKILSAVFDDRTGADSYAVHGQIRRPEEPFEWWDGEYLYPPNRPNDREVVVSHRMRWVIPEYLQPKEEDEIQDAWTRGGRKGSPPETPENTTVDRDLFGQQVARAPSR